jgi:rhodanese-related sulfurtransferase
MMALLMGLKTVSPAGLQAMLEAGTVTVIDVNPPQSWSAGHVPGARNLDPQAYTERDLPSDKAATVVFYCSNFLCRKAPNAARRAKGMGYTDVRVLSAGIGGWLDLRLPVERG